MKHVKRSYCIKQICFLEATKSAIVMPNESCLCIMLCIGGPRGWSDNFSANSHKEVRLVPAPMSVPLGIPPRLRGGGSAPVSPQ